MLKPAFQEACRAACEELARETADGGPGVAGRPALGRGRRALQRLRACSTAGGSRRCGSRSTCPITACSTRSACSRPDRRRGRSSFAACASAFRSARTSGAPTRSSASLETGGEILLVPNASPYERDKLAIRQNIAVARVVESGLPLIYLNMVGGQDELVFEGGSFALNADRSARRAIAGLPADGRAHRLGARATRAGAASRASAKWSRRATRPIMRPACWACATMSRTTAFPASCSAFPAASIRRFARRWRSTRSGAARVHAVMLPYRFTSNESLVRRRGLRQGARHPLRHRADRRAGRGRRACAESACSPASRATSRKRTSRAARAA